MLKKTAPLIGQDLLSGVWPPIDRWCLVRLGCDGEKMIIKHGSGVGDEAELQVKPAMERGGGTWQWR